MPPPPCLPSHGREAAPLREEGALIWAPRPGQRVVLRYRREARARCPHGATGVVRIAARGAGPRNALVELDRGGFVLVPRGNLFGGK